MNSLSEVAPAFVEMAHAIVWCLAATVDAKGRPRTRILHPMWQRDVKHLVGWIATSPTPITRAHLSTSPYMSINYWSPAHDTCVAECRAEWIRDDAGRTELWNLFLNTPPPVGYNPTLIPAWTSPTCDAFAGLKLLWFTITIARRPEFRIAAADYGGALAILLVGTLYAWVRWRQPGAAWLIGGVVVTLVGSVLQARRVGLHRHFNHNDLFHVVQMAALYLFYRGGALLVDR